MTDKLDTIFGNSPCLTRSEMLAYLEGGLSGEELRRVELHLADCEFCTDALEGLRMMAPARVEDLLKKTDDTIRQTATFKKERSVAGRPWMRAAAAVALLIVGSFVLNYYLSDSNEKNIAQSLNPVPDTLNPADGGIGMSSASRGQDANERKSTEAAKELKLENKPETFSPSFSTAGKKYAPSGNAASNQSSVAFDYDDAAREETYAVAEDITDSKYKSVTVADSVTLSTNGAVKSIDAEATSISKDKNRAESDNMELYAKTTKKPASPTAREDYKQGNYSDALKRFKKILNDEPTNAEANYYAGLCEVNLKHYTSAITYFNKVLTLPLTNYYSDAQWQKALALIAKGDNTNAKILLNDIINAGGTYKEQARQQLNQLK